MTVHKPQHITSEKKKMFRYYPEVNGGHVHVRCFIGNGLAGTLVMTIPEWDEFLAINHKSPQVEVHSQKAQDKE